MEISVVIEPVAGNGYRALWSPLGMTAEGPTREEAAEALRIAIEKRLAAGAELRTFHFPPLTNPLSRYEGVYENDPLFDDWQQAIAEYRQGRH